MPKISRLAVVAVLAAAVLTACSSTAGSETADVGPGKVAIGALSNGAAQEVTLSVPQVDAIRAQLPAAIRDGGTFTIGLGFLPSGSPPLGYIGSDQKTPTGSEPDLGRLVAAVLGLKPQLANATWDNLFVGIDSGKNTAGFSNITDTEKRKEKYDFACYRKDNLAFEVQAKSTWNFDGKYQNLAGLIVAVDSGTNQEKILLEWQNKLKAQGKTLTVKRFADHNAVALALKSGKIDAYFAPNPSVAYRATQSKGSPTATRSAGQFSGAGETLQGLICATTKKDNGLIKPIAAAINYLIDNGQYQKLLAAWNLTDESVTKAEINPPGLPLTNA
ncbi:transporter substrate-binding domain-containing protein [Cryptosporangium phraense]|uniref:Transporter substrate-binding domain-containing protein n=1 Tax=Cryptosporangium phraense TaxID=2593070 RepID=A0A545ARS8_9ACTN|nr:transporter substrate-binding domain-containing protein [Cryptosporangium phraense]TQS44038.1 transporter substrate-binding domain-containing protein [Cryptosporangium phraense]